MVEVGLMNSAAQWMDLDPAEVLRDRRSRIHRYLLSMARDPDVAEDLTRDRLHSECRRVVRADRL